MARFKLIYVFNATKIIPIHIKFLTFIPYRGVQPSAWGFHAAQGDYECGPKQNHKFT